jgi:hypothetical protein
MNVIEDSRNVRKKKPKCVRGEGEMCGFNWRIQSVNSTSTDAAVKKDS